VAQWGCMTVKGRKQQKDPRYWPRVSPKSEERRERKRLPYGRGLLAKEYPAKSGSDCANDKCHEVEIICELMPALCPAIA